MKIYHAHIYFDSNNASLKELILEINHLDAKYFKFHKLHQEKVGPHALPMIELHFTESYKAEVVEWLSSHRRNFSVLIHEDTGNDIQDHLEPIWLGKKLAIDFTFFSKVLHDPSLSIH